MNDFFENPRYVVTAKCYRFTLAHAGSMPFREWQRKTSIGWKLYVYILARVHAIFLVQQPQDFRTRLYTW